jgi:hypothetical protein
MATKGDDEDSVTFSLEVSRFMQNGLVIMMSWNDRLSLTYCIRCAVRVFFENETRSLPLAYLWLTFGLPLAYLWLTFGLPLAYLWLTFGLPLASQRQAKGKPKASQRQAKAEPQPMRSHSQCGATANAEPQPMRSHSQGGATAKAEPQPRRSHSQGGIMLTCSFTVLQLGSLMITPRCRDQSSSWGDEEDGSAAAAAAGEGATRRDKVALINT